MCDLTNLLSLGKEYTVTDTGGNVITYIQVILASDILDAAIGLYDENLGDYSSYIAKSVAVLSGFDSIDPTRVLWYATSDEEISLEDIIEYAIKHGYNRIILEHLEEIE
jgi:hypothetical protein